MGRQYSRYIACNSHHFGDSLFRWIRAADCSIAYKHIRGIGWLRNWLSVAAREPARRMGLDSYLPGNGQLSFDVIEGNSGAS